MRNKISGQPGGVGPQRMRMRAYADASCCRLRRAGSCERCGRSGLCGQEQGGTGALTLDGIQNNLVPALELSERPCHRGEPLTAHLPRLLRRQCCQQLEVRALPQCLQVGSVARRRAHQVLEGGRDEARVKNCGAMLPHNRQHVLGRAAGGQVPLQAPLLLAELALTAAASYGPVSGNRGDSQYRANQVLAPSGDCSE